MIADIDRPDADIEADVQEVPINESEGPAGSDEAPSKGKGSRWNSLKHSLMAKVLFTDSLAGEIERFTAILTERFLPKTPYEFAQIAIMGRAGAQLERLRQLKVADMQRAMDRAAF